MFYAWATLATVLLLRFNTPQLGIVLAREMYLYPLLLGPVLAAMVRALPTRPPLAPAVLVVLFLFVAIPFQPVWHEPDVNAFAGPVLGRMTAAPGGMVLVENNPHWDMVATPGQRSLRSHFNSHYESLLPAATGKRIFGQPQDGYHRAPSGAGPWRAAPIRASSSPRRRPSASPQTSGNGVSRASSSGPGRRPGIWTGARSSRFSGSPTRGGSTRWLTLTSAPWLPLTGREDSPVTMRSVPRSRSPASWLVTWSLSAPTTSRRGWPPRMAGQMVCSPAMANWHSARPATGATT